VGDDVGRAAVGIIDGESVGSLVGKEVEIAVDDMGYFVGASVGIAVSKFKQESTSFQLQCSNPSNIASVVYVHLVSSKYEKVLVWGSTEPSIAKGDWQILPEPSQV
jgi:hypothetical protein